jgi:hypothetical protein
MKVKALIDLLTQFDAECEVELQIRHAPNYANYGLYTFEEESLDVEKVYVRVEPKRGTKGKEIVVIKSLDGY